MLSCQKTLKQSQLRMSALPGLALMDCFEFLWKAAKILQGVKFITYQEKNKVHYDIYWRKKKSWQLHVKCLLKQFNVLSLSSERCQRWEQSMGKMLPGDISERNGLHRCERRDFGRGFWIQHVYQCSFPNDNFALRKTLGPYSVAMHSSYLLRLKLLVFLFIHRACVKLSVLTRY